MVGTVESEANDALHIEPILAVARAQSNISGLLDDEIIEPITRLLDALRTEAKLSEQGIRIAQSQIASLLVTRARIREMLRRYPEILKEEIRHPVIIVGLPRTGTTKLQRSLAASGAFQNLPLWKILNPLPIPADPSGTDSRIAIAERFVSMLQQVIPDFYAGHPMIATEPDEEPLLQELSFLSESFCFMFNIPSYQKWVVSRNTESSYRGLKSVLQLLQWQDERGRPKRPWLLKSPTHIGRLREIVSVFPDAVMVHCHRDFQQAVPSGAALTASMRSLYTGKRDNMAAGNFALELFGNGWKVNREARKKPVDSHATYMDLQFGDIVKDADGIAKRIFDALEIPFTTEARIGMQRWERENPAHRHGKFVYDLPTYGFTAERINDFFA